MRPFLLIILDGWGWSTKKEGNAIQLAHIPNWHDLLKNYPFGLLDASGESVGLPKGTIGNSEVGHMNIGAGRVVYQDLTRIQRSIESGTFFQNEVFSQAMAACKKSGTSLHLIGLLSEGGVHSHLDHLFALIDLASKQSVPQIWIHCFMDGRDTSPHAGKGYLERLAQKLEGASNIGVATVIGRYYAMDRDKRWNRTALAYEAIVEGVGQRASSALKAIENSYNQRITDEFVAPTVIVPEGENPAKIKEGDVIIFFNFRADRTRQLTDALTKIDFDGFKRAPLPRLGPFVTMTEYHKDYKFPVAFLPQDLTHVLGEVLATHGLRQFRIAESEKYAHVTYFVNGGRETTFAGEERLLIPSLQDVPTYDQKPEMSAEEVTKAVLTRLDTRQDDVIILNYANPDMVGHSGNLEATIKACEVVDRSLGQILGRVKKSGGWALVTADHGNAECMVGEDGKPHTAHTLNPVPCVLFSQAGKGARLRDSGLLCDIAPTILELLRIPKPEVMTGKSLLGS